jgi:4-amino-4-deoxy-L-arabinose transferase-like glycosyltransferase
MLAKETVREEERWFPALIIATMPMIVSFSTLFYMDVPMTALSTLSVYLILKKRYIEAGVASGLAYFTKLNSVFFFPGFLFLIFWNERERVWSLLRNLVFFTLPVLMIYFPDSYWRKKNIINAIGLSTGLHYVSVTFTGTRIKEYVNSYLTNPVDLVKYVGLPFLFFVFFHLFYFRRWNRKAAILWVPIISYLILFMVIFGVGSDIRYAIPIVPYLVAFFTQSFFSLGRKWRLIIVGVCVLQFVSTTYYVHLKRQLSPEIEAAFWYIRNNVPKDALILYPEENLLIYGQRRVIWSAGRVLKSGPDVSLKTIFWGSTSEEMNRSLRINGVSHILIKRSRIYDDREVRHFGGYPQSFVERLPHLDGWVKIFENPGVELWKMTQSTD